jgi:crotonobetainyl-CoA:carnitine CoA-transferase CaiB-like acyl-CoA transferase
MSQDKRTLDGIKILDLSRFIAGPFCAMQLGDLGAEVVKVERKDIGEDTRAI